MLETARPCKEPLLNHQEESLALLLEQRYLAVPDSEQQQSRVQEQWPEVLLPEGLSR